MTALRDATVPSSVVSPPTLPLFHGCRSREDAPSWFSGESQASAWPAQALSTAASSLEIGITGLEMMQCLARGSTYCKCVCEKPGRTRRSDHGAGSALVRERASVRHTARHVSKCRGCAWKVVGGEKGVKGGGDGREAEESAVGDSDTE